MSEDISLHKLKISHVSDLYSTSHPWLTSVDLLTEYVHIEMATKYCHMHECSLIAKSHNYGNRPIHHWYSEHIGHTVLADQSAVIFDLFCGFRWSR